MSSSTSSEDVLARIIKRDIEKIARNSAILYILNALAYFFWTSVVVLFGPVEPLSIVDVILGGVAAYAILVYLWIRYSQARFLRLHFYLLGLSGLAVGAPLFAWGGIQFLSGARWLRQYRKGGTVRSRRGGGEIIVYGGDRLVDTKSSRLVRIGYDYPKQWSYAGAFLVAVGVLLTSLPLPTSGNAVLAFITRAGLILFIDGVAILTVGLAGGIARFSPVPKERDSSKT